MPFWFAQFCRFALVGLVSNGLLYVAYLGLTALGISPKLAMSLLYAAGMAQTFFLNKGWTFGHEGANRMAFGRYAMVYGAGYLLNLLALEVCVTRLRMNHQLVQGVTIPVLAVFTFVTQRCWVFRKNV